MAALADVLDRADDIVFEEDVARNPYSIRHWWTYVQAKRDSSAKTRVLVYERALKFLPACYKIWHDYLLFRRQKVRGRNLDHPSWGILTKVYERALVFLHKMPVIWLEYLNILMDQKLGTATRRGFDKALQALPVTQHGRIWPVYIKWAKEFGVVPTALKVYRRYLTFDPAYREEFSQYLISIGRYDEGVKQLADMVNDDAFVSVKGTAKHALWLQLCDVISKHPDDISSVDVEGVIRAGIRRFTDETGRLWCALADYFIRLGVFEKARDVYEEGMAAVMTVRDFTIVFDAYALYEETMLAAKIDLRNESVGEESEELNEDIDLRLARLERLMDTRPQLLSLVLLRQNPHNVHEWLKRTKLFKKTTEKINVFTEAVKTVDATKAVGKPHTLWVEFAKLYESEGALQQARDIFKRATESAFKSVEDYAAVWCEWAEMEIRQKQYAQALAVMQQAIAEPPRRSAKQMLTGAPTDVPVKDRVHRSVKLWALYIDLEESLGNLATTKAAYERAIDIKVITPQMVLNYGAYLEERGYFEDSFRAYERGVNLFGFPHVKELWLAYLTKFVERYGSRKLERARELFELAVTAAPPTEAMLFYNLYAKLEEDHGLIRHAMSIYDRATTAVAEGDRAAMFTKYIAKAEEYFGATKTRDIYAKAIEALPDKEAKDFCLKFAALEKRLGEIDRARAILVHGSQFCDPRTEPDFWTEWHEFEVAHGNHDTYREMLRVKRSVAAQFSSVNVTTQELLAQAEELKRKEKELKERAAAAVAATASDSHKRKRERPANWDEEGGAIVDKDDEPVAAPVAEPEDDEDELEQKALPSSLFGEAAAADSDRPPVSGALNLFKRQKPVE